MDWNFIFFANAILLGLGLSMDAFSVSIVNALLEPQMKRPKQCLVAGTYAAFQFAMPMAGWICARWLFSAFRQFQKFIPWIALLLLLYVGIKMILESVRPQKEECRACKKDACASCQSRGQQPLSAGVLLLQGIATSIDALSAGFAIAEYGALMAATAALIIAAVTFLVCMFGLLIGKNAGRRLSSRAQIAGGVILIFIGIEIFVRAKFF